MLDSIPTRAFLSTTIGIALASGFVFGNLTLSLITIPTLLIPPPPSGHTPTIKPASVATPKPATPAPHLARQWRNIFEIGMRTFPVGVLVSSMGYVDAALGLSEKLAQRRLRMQLLILAAVLNVMIVPYTAVFMGKVNDKLKRRASDADGFKEEDAPKEGDVLEVGMGTDGRAEDLIMQWAKLNLGRAMLPVAGAVCAITALVME